MKSSHCTFLPLFNFPSPSPLPHTPPPHPLRSRSINNSCGNHNQNNRDNNGNNNRCLIFSIVTLPITKTARYPNGEKSKIINSIFVPTLTYQCQSWTTTKPLERRITTCEMRCLRKAVYKTRRDMIHNTKIREMVGTKSIHHYSQQQRMKWFGHLTRLPIHHPAQRAYNTRFSCRKARGLPERPGAGITEVDDRLVTTVFTVQPSFHHRHSTNRVL